MSTSESMLRMLTLLPWLRSRGPVEMSEVAAHFGISEDQLVDELATLTFVGPGQGGGELVDISYEAGGTVAVHDSQGLEFALRLSTAEAASLITGLTLLTELPASRGSVDAAISALAKLEEAAGAAIAGAAGAVVISHEHVDPSVELAISEALKNQHRLALQYVSAAREDLSEREVDPMRLIVIEGRAYLEAWCYLAEGVRMFRLDRIVSASVTATPVNIPADAHGRDADDPLLPVGTDVRLHLARAAEHITEIPSCLRRETLPDGSLDALVRVADPGWLVRLMLSLGDQARIVDDPELSAMVAQRAQEALAAYSE